MNKEKIRYRKANQNDSELVFEIKKKSLKPYIEQIWGWNEKQQLEFHKGKFDYKLIKIIKYGKSEIGFYELNEKKGATIINNILIIDKYQSRGIGKEVIKKIMHNSINNNKSIRLQVFKINVKAQRFYEKLGFKVINQMENHFEMELKH